MNKHRATYAGRTFTRNSKARRYSHAVLAIIDVEKSLAWQRAHTWQANASADQWERHAAYERERCAPGADGVHVGVWGWASRAELAQKAKADAERRIAGDPGWRFVVVEAEGA